MDDPLPAIYTQCFREHPDSFEGVRLRARRAGQAPEVAMNAATLKRFIVWGQPARLRRAVPAAGRGGCDARPTCAHVGSRASRLLSSSKDGLRRRGTPTARRGRELLTVYFTPTVQKPGNYS